MGRSFRRSLLVSAIPLGFALTGAPAAARAADASSTASPTASEIVVTGRRLDQARDTIQPQTGASTYTLSSQAIQAMPGGDNAQLNQVILQAPGVAQDSYGQLHIRGEHNGLQFRLNGVILPEGLSVFSQSLSPRLAGKVELITGALPAEYGLRTAGIVDITTKSGYRNGGSVSLYGGSHGDVEPSFEAGGGDGSTNFFVSGSYLRNGLGIESPDGRADPLHDKTEQFNGFGYVEHIVDPSSRVSVILGTSDQRFQIPDVSGGLNGGLGYTVDARTDYPSDQLNENQVEATQYAVVSYLHTTEKFTSQVSLFGRYSQLDFSPDVTGDLLYNGISQSAAKTDTAGGLQAETAYHLNDAHTMRGGVIVEIDRATSQTSSEVLLIGNDPRDQATFGQQISDTPFAIKDSSARTAQTFSAYLQDEWKLLDNLTLNYGLRFDQFDGFRDENQLSPRINLVWKATRATTVHAGYARYFSPPPFELVGGETISKFVEPTGSHLVTSSAAPSVTTDTTPYAERADYFDVGAAQALSRALTVTIDSYYKQSTHTVDEGQFGAPVILTPFNYARAKQWGVELTLSYTKGHFTAYANAAHAVAQGKDWISSQFNFVQPELDYVATHYIYLDHDQAYSISAGASYLWRGTRFGGDVIFGSGLRAGLPLAANSSLALTYPGLTQVPNGKELPGYTVVNLALSHRFETTPAGPVELRLDVINLFDKVYQIRDGSGVGVFAPQYGARRGVFGGITKEF